MLCYLTSLRQFLQEWVSILKTPATQGIIMQESTKIQAYPYARSHVIIMNIAIKNHVNTDVDSSTMLCPVSPQNLHIIVFYFDSLNFIISISLF
jgi:hypothetical protein